MSEERRLLRRALPHLALLRTEHAEAVEWGILEPEELRRVELLIQDIEGCIGETAEEIINRRDDHVR